MTLQNADIRGLVERFVKELASAVQARGIYGGRHKLSHDAVARLSELLRALCAGGRGEVTIGIIGDDLAFEKEPLYGLSRTVSGFVASLKDIGVEKMTFLCTPDDTEIVAFLDIIGKSPKAVEEAGGVEKLVGGAGLSHIIIGRIGYPREGLGGMAAGSLASMAQGVFRDGETCLAKTFDDIRQNKPIDISVARFFVIKLIGNLARNKHSLLMLTSIKSHDEATFVHSINVAIFSVVQGEALGIGERALTEIGIAGLLHDTGKVAMSGDLLRKRGGLDEHDIEEIHRHPIAGAKLLIETLEANPLTAIAAFEHHIRFDQKGYPPRLFGGAVNPASMMVAIADVYDALRSKRSYHEDMAPEKTYEEMMKMSGVNFDPRLLANFFQIVGVFPPGTVVELDDHSIGIVLRQSSLDIRRPQVEILYDASGNKPASSLTVNLLEQDRATGQFRRTIVKSVAPGKYEIPERYTI